MAQTVKESGDDDELAEAMIADFCRQTPFYAPGHLALAKRLLARGDYSGAAECYFRAAGSLISTLLPAQISGIAAFPTLRTNRMSLFTFADTLRKFEEHLPEPSHYLKLQAMAFTSADVSQPETWLEMVRDLLRAGIYESAARQVENARFFCAEDPMMLHVTLSLGLDARTLLLDDLQASLLHGQIKSLGYLPGT
ncbi:MAG: hypothetical protein NUW37_10445 [Planctomycetes bacterium]|nr:hypothetical protein [Planctomycetota bacterium]